MFSTTTALTRKFRKLGFTALSRPISMNTAHVKIAGPYLALQDFYLANGGYFKSETSMVRAWELYSATIQSCSMHPALLYSNNRLQSFKIYEQGDDIIQTGRVYAPKVHSLDINAAWILANCHKGREFISLSALYGVNVGHVSGRQFVYSCFTKEIAWIYKAGYRITKFTHAPHTDDTSQQAHFSRVKLYPSIHELCLHDLSLKEKDYSAAVTYFFSQLKEHHLNRLTGTDKKMKPR